MIPNGEGVGAVLDDPVVGRDSGIDKEQNIVGKTIAFKADLRRDLSACRGLLVDGSKGHGRELGSVFAIKDHAVDRVGIRGAFDPVKHHVSHGDLSLHGLALGLRRNDAGENGVE